MYDETKDYLTVSTWLYTIYQYLSLPNSTPQLLALLQQQGCLCLDLCKGHGVYLGK